MHFIKAPLETKIKIKHKLSLFYKKNKTIKQPIKTIKK